MTCDRAVYNEGFKCIGLDYPDFMYGQFLPGDEPGYRCDGKLGEPCDPDYCPLGEEYWYRHAPDCEPENEVGD